jgi:hypothetical protein
LDERIEQADADLPSKFRESPDIRKILAKLLSDCRLSPGRRRSCKATFAKATISYVKKDFPTRAAKDMTAPFRDPFTPGTLAVVSLGNPKAKFWGMVLASAPAGLSLCGVDLASLEDLAAMVRDGEPCTPAVVFFPMHRVERMELDLRSGGVPSLAERLFATTGLHAANWFLPSTIQREAEVKGADGAVKGQTVGQTS